MLLESVVIQHLLSSGLTVLITVAGLWHKVVSPMLKAKKEYDIFKNDFEHERDHLHGRIDSLKEDVAKEINSHHTRIEKLHDKFDRMMSDMSDIKTFMGRLEERMRAEK